MPETQVLGEAALVSTMGAGSVESDLGTGFAENVSVPLQELPLNSDPEEPVTHEETVPLSSNSLEIPEAYVPVTAETEPEPLLTDFTSEDKVSTLEMEEHVLLSSENSDAANVELIDESIPLAAAEPGPEVVEAVVAPVLGTSESQAQYSVEETTEVIFTHVSSAGSLVNCNKIIKDVHTVEAASEAVVIVPNEGQLRSAMEELPTNSRLESTVETVEVQLEMPEARESDHLTEVEPQITPAIVEESPAQIEEDKPVLVALQVRPLISHFLTY